MRVFPALRTRLLAPLSLLALSLTAACGAEDEIAVPLDDVAIDHALAVDSVDPDSADSLLAGYCDDVTTWDSNWVKFESDVLALVNQKRAAGAPCGGAAKPVAGPLALETKLRCAARKHSKDMGTKNFVSHTGSNGSTFTQRMASAGYTSFRAAAENIAAGQTTAASVVASWMGSLGHCTNIMNGTYTQIGIGYFYAPTSSYKHYWTQDFAKP